MYSTTRSDTLPHALSLHALHLRQNSIVDLLALSPLLRTLLHADRGADHDGYVTESDFLGGLGTVGEGDAGAVEEGEICFVAV